MNKLAVKVLAYTERLRCQTVLKTLLVNVDLWNLRVNVDSINFTLCVFGLFVTCS